MSAATSPRPGRPTLHVVAGQRWDARRLLARLCGVAGVLLVVLSLRLDQAVRTAYASDWTRRAAGTLKEPVHGCLDCRLPDWRWISLHALAAGVGIVLLLFAVRLSRRTQKGE